MFIFNFFFYLRYHTKRYPVFQKTMAETGEKGISSDIEENCDRDAANSHWRNYWIRGEWWSHGIFTSGDQKSYTYVFISPVNCYVMSYYV